jgi:hypothetical protein
MSHSRKDIHKIFLIPALLLLILLNNCQRDNYIDPFWNVNLNADKTSILNDLNEKTLKGDFKSCIFYFERIFYVKTKKFDSRLTGNLNYPVFVNDTLSEMSYSFVVEFRNDTTYAFNNDFYKYFIGELERSYGKPQEETMTENTISIKWVLKNGMTVIAQILKDLNSYHVQFQKQK